MLDGVPERVAELGPLGPAYFIGAVVLACALLLPVTPLMVSAGYLFGFPLGVAVTLASVCASAAVNFLLARSLLREQARKLVEQDERLAMVGRAVEREGLRVICLLRLSPLLPFAASSYALGLTGVALADYLLATALGYAPWTVAFVLSSSLARDFFDASSWYTSLAGVALTAALLKLAADVVEAAIQDAAPEAAPASALEAGRRQGGGRP